MTVVWYLTCAILFIFCLKFSMGLDWRKYPSMAAAMFFLALGTSLLATHFPPWNLYSEGCILLACVIGALRYLAVELMRPKLHIPPVDRRKIMQVEDGELTRTIRSFERKAA